MTHTTEYPMSVEAVKIVMTETNGNFRGRFVKESENGVSLYASNADHRAFEDFIERIVGRTQSPAVMQSAPAPATARQIAFLSRLVRNDPGAAMTIGASADGSTVRGDLSKGDASRMIDLMLAGV